MEQAPLVYASKSTIGLGISGGTAENPGLDLIIGYKDTNVALVPVAVAKRCVGQSTKCEHPIYRMEVVKGDRLDTLDSGTIQARFDERQKILAAKEVERIAINDRLSAAKKLIGEYDEKTRLDAELTRLGTAVAGEDPNFPTERIRLTTARDAIAITPSQHQKALSDIAAWTNDSNNLDIDIKGERENLRSLAASLRSSQNGTRNDAYSVYGTFQGGANGDGSGGALDGSRVFATGIAAQNLTESLGFTQCLINIEKVAKQFPASTADADRKAFLEKALVYCAGTKDRD